MRQEQCSHRKVPRVTWQQTGIYCPYIGKRKHWLLRSHHCKIPAHDTSLNLPGNVHDANYFTCLHLPKSASWTTDIWTCLLSFFVETYFSSFYLFQCISSVQSYHVQPCPKIEVACGQNPGCCLFSTAHGTALVDQHSESCKASQSSFHSRSPFHPWMPCHWPHPALVTTYMLGTLLFGNCWVLSGGVLDWKTEKPGISMSSPSQPHQLRRPGSLEEKRASGSGVAQ